MLSPASLQNHWPKSSFDPKIIGENKPGPRPWRLYIALSLNSLAGTGLNCTSDWIFPCESYYYMGHIFYHNFCNYLKYHVCLFSLLQPINVYLINVKKREKCGFYLGTHGWRRQQKNKFKSSMTKQLCLNEHEQIYIGTHTEIMRKRNKTELQKGQLEPPFVQRNHIFSQRLVAYCLFLTTFFTYILSAKSFICIFALNKLWAW